MTLEVDFVPFATGTGANVTAQSTYVAERTTQTGYQSGTASSADCNKAWRQGTVMASVLANWIANTLSVNVLDNGNLSAQITLLTNAVSTAAATAATTVVNNTLASFTLPFTSITGQISSAQVPQGAVTQYQSQLQIQGSQISGLTLPFTSITGQIASGQVPQGAVTQYQSDLQIGGSQISGAISVNATITATAFNVSSDARLKKEIAPIEGALAKIGLLRGVTFTWRENGQHCAGLIAQDLAKVMPEGVQVSKPGGTLRIDPMAVIGLLVEALNEERHERRALETRVAALEATP